MINKKRDRGTGRRLMVSKVDEDDIVNYYRKIESLFRQLQVSGSLNLLLTYPNGA